MSETQDPNEAIKAGALLMYQVLTQINTLHDALELEAEDGTKVEGCEHCSELADAIIHYPCPTVQLLLGDLASEVPDAEETPAE